MVRHFDKPFWTNKFMSYLLKVNANTNKFMSYLLKVNANTRNVERVGSCMLSCKQTYGRLSVPHSLFANFKGGQKLESGRKSASGER